MTRRSSRREPRRSQTANTLAPRRATVARAVHATKVYGSGDTAVRALDDVTVDVRRGRFTAIMGPSGSGKSTLCTAWPGSTSSRRARSSSATSTLGALSDKELTLLRRERIGFVFQSFNLVPTLTALENITLPTALAGASADREWLDARDRHRRPARPAGAPAVGAVGWPAAARRRGPGARQPARRSSSPTSRRATSTPARAPRCSGSCARPSATWARRS